MKRTLLFLIFFGVIISFGFNNSSTTFSQKLQSDSLYFNFCNLKQNLNRTVRIKATYSGVEEYWGLYSMTKCDPKISVDFDIDNIYDKLKPKYKKILTKVHNNYWKSYLIVDAIGVFEMGEKGYGHLNHNQATFRVDRIISLELVNKTK